MGRGVKPAREARMPRQRGGFSREKRKHELRHVLRPVRITAARAQRGAVNEIDVPPHELRERVLGARPRIAAKQLGIIDHAIHPVMATRSETEQRIAMGPCLATDSPGWSGGSRSNEVSAARDAPTPVVAHLAGP
jgi:hypothetical protein